MPAVPAVRTGPERTALNRTPRGPYSAAHALVSSSTAALLDPYGAMPAAPYAATMVLTLTIAPPPPSAIAGASSATRWNGAFTFSA